MNYTLQEAIAKVEKCDFECEAGPLQNNVGFRRIKQLAENGPKFIPGQIVEFEVKAEAHGEKFSKWVSATVTSCIMGEAADKIVWDYEVQRQPPAPYFRGTEPIKIKEHELRAVAAALALAKGEGE